MRCALIALAPAMIAPAAYGAPPLTPGTYTNEEEVYFDTEAGKLPAPWVGIKVDAAGKITPVDKFGQPSATRPIALETSQTPERWIASFPNRDTELRRARPVTCWASLKRDTPKADGKEDWTFSKDIKLHDQGGRALVGKGESGVKPVILRMRNVTWSGSARSTNRPSLVLYVHTQDEPDKAVSYVWADPGAARIGVNLRWMQASCTIDGMEKN